MKGAKEYNFVDNEVNKLLRNGYIKEVETIPTCVLLIQTVPKKSGKLRLVVDCRHVNKFVRAPKFKQEGIDAVAEQIKEGDKLISVGLEDGFQHISMHDSCVTYFGMRWRNRFYVWLVLPFGCSASPYLFKKILEPVTTFLRAEFAMRLALFVDDFLQMSESVNVTSNKDDLIDTLLDLEWKFNEKKSQLVPDVHCVFIGFDVYSVGKNGPWIKVLPIKIRKLKGYLRRVLCKTTVTVRMLTKVAGQCVAMTKAVLPGKLLLRNVYCCLAKRLSWSDSLFIDNNKRSDLLWWQNALNSWNGAPLNLKTPELQIILDASGTGYGAWIPGVEVEVSGVWSSDVAKKALEFQGVINYSHSNSIIQRVHLRQECADIDRQHHSGGLPEQIRWHKRRAYTDSKNIFMECQDLEVSITVGHLRGILNGRADELSHQVSPYEWMLHRKIFKVIDDMWGLHQVDRFASLNTMQLPVYNSFFADPCTSAVDAMGQNRKDVNNFVNPPFFLIGKILSKICQQKAVATLIAPWWPNQVWFQKLRSMALCPPLEIPNLRKTMWKCLTVPEPRRNPSWRLFAWRISGEGD